MLATALVLSLDPAPPAAPRGLAQVVVIDPAPKAEAPLRSQLWVPAGGYGMGATFGGAAGILVEYSTRRTDNQRNVRAPLLSASAGFVLGALPGLLLGDSARLPDNEKARGAVGILDLAGTAALFYAARQIFR